MQDLLKALKKLHPNDEWILTGTTLDGLEFIDKTIQKPTQKQINNAIEQVMADELAEAEAKAQAKAELLKRLGITADEAKLLLS